MLWKVLRAVGSEYFSEVLGEPVLLNWVTDQINNDEIDRNKLVTSIFDAAKPWLNLELYQEVEKKKQQETNKIEKLAGTSAENVETVNAYDQFMKNLGIKAGK